MEATPRSGGQISAELDRIEAAVAGGQTDLTSLGFWRVVGRVKRDPELAAAEADRIGRIDQAAFRAAVRIRIPVWVGNALLSAGVVFGAICLWFANTLPGATLANYDPAVVAGIACLLAGAVWDVALHSPTHWIVGRSIGIRFTSYFVKSLFAAPGLKTDYATYLRADPGQRAWFHASGALATKVAPFLALALAPWDLVPWWSVAGLLALGVFQIATDILISTKRSDWKKFARERRVARDLASPDPR